MESSLDLRNRTGRSEPTVLLSRDYPLHHLSTVLVGLRRSLVKCWVLEIIVESRGNNEISRSVFHESLPACLEVFCCEAPNHAQDDWLLNPE